jgi:DNA-binding NarL/FixJ family response regulator
VLRAIAHMSEVRVILLTVAADKHEVIEALQLGVRGLILKDAATGTLAKCIRAVMAGEYWLGRNRMHDVIVALRQLREAPRPSPAQTLTAAEHRIVAAVVSGATNRDIAEELRLSEQTVKNYLSHIFDKLGVSNRLELALYAMHHKLVRDATSTTDG